MLYNPFNEDTYKENATPKASTPVMNPAGGTYNSDQDVTITCATSGATIYYTTNGSEPTGDSDKYTGPI